MMAIHDQEVHRSPATSGGGDRQLDFHPAMEMRWEITRSSQDTSGELFEATNWFDPRMKGPPVHVHPGQEESFEVIEGTLDVFVDGKWSQVRAGETATVQPGVAHTFRNASDKPLAVVTRFRPALRSEAYFRELHRLIHEGKIRRLPPREPRTGIYGAMFLCAYPDEIRTTKPPHWVFKAVALVGRALRLKL